MTVFVNDCPIVRVKSHSIRFATHLAPEFARLVPHYFFLRYCLAAIREMKTVFVAPSTGVTLLFYQAGLTPSREGRRPGGTNHPLPIAAPHKLCFLLQLLIYSQKQRVDIYLLKRQGYEKVCCFTEDWRFQRQSCS